MLMQFSVAVFPALILLVPSELGMCDSLIKPKNDICNIKYKASSLACFNIM